ncbi:MULTISPECIES: hypothetical protein [Pseudoalteromonas]|jgi:hypothetical protein|uniref:Uncharacterized protein n=1 Tax=Pseudoalteromonas agarivorans TaxID=176102 RepID=A0AAD0U478_9GAMM|nr:MULTISPECIES: hypothetical protein [Pseudoalteromonas]AYM88776.1 hypothetical protein D9T18_19055 [Pseudoalteromonas agarivorans]MDN3474474.1 hypothetical protein [Pseudoalteromonas sp. APC 3355]
MINLNDFSIENEDDPQLDTELPDYPGDTSWMNELTPKQSAVVKKVTARFIEARDTIMASEKPKSLKIRERTIIATKLAEMAVVDKSNIRKDRMDIMPFKKYLEHYNDTLNAIWQQRCNTCNSGRRLSRKELEVKKGELELKYEQELNKNLVEYFQAALHSEVAQNQIETAQKLRELKIDYEKAQQTIANLRSQLREMTMQVNRKN